MKARNVLRWSIPSVLLIAGSTYALTLDGARDTQYGGSQASQQSSVIEVFSPPFAVEIQTDNSNVGGVGALAATNFKGEPGDVITGLEIEADLVELGWDGTSPIRIAAFVNGSGVNFLANQVVGGLDPASPQGLAGGNIGAPPFNFDDGTGPAYAPGQQYVTVATVLGSATITVDGIADEADWSGTTLYTNGVAAAPGTENPTGFGDNNDPSVVTANGSEIDVFRAFRTGSKLYVHIGGNIETNYNKLGVFFDTRPGGENVITGTPNFGFGGLGNMTGSQFDTTPDLFAFDYYLQYGADTNNQYIDVAELLTDTTTFAGGDRGSNTPIVLASGLNAGMISCTVDNSNTVGITGVGGGDGVDVAAVSAPSGVATGCEFSVDLDALGWNGTDPINIVGFLTQGDQMSNQVIGGIPNDSGVLGPGDGVNFSTIPGNQYATISAIGAGLPVIDGSITGDGYTQLYVNDAGGTGNSTSFDDATSDGGFNADPVGSEIDALYAKIVNDGSTNKLYCVVAGNFGQYQKLGVLFDTKPGGQGTLRGDNPDVSGNFFNNLGGLTFDTGVEPDFAIVYNLGTNLGDDGMVGGTGPDADVVEHYCDAVELATNGAEDQPAGGPIGGGVKDATPISGDLVSRTGFGNNTLSDGVFANGSELDTISAYCDGTDLYLFLGGNLETNYTKLEVFLDIIPSTGNGGGQNTLVYDADPPTIEDPPGSGTFIPNPDYTGNPDIDYNALNRMGGPYPIPGTDPQEFQPGLTFDADFAADYYIYATAGGDDPLFPGEPEWYGGIARLYDALDHDPGNNANPDPGAVHYWGGTSVSDGGEFFDTPGELAGLFINNSNVLGVAGGPDQYEPDDSAPSSVSTGIEIRIPLDQILVNDPVDPVNNPAVTWDGNSTFRVCAFINGGFHSFVSNQFLQSICDGELGEPRVIDLETQHAGPQYVELQPNTTVPTAYTNIAAGPDPCVEPMGACCVDQVCSENVLEGDCITLGGTFLGDMTDCSGGCPAPEGACCLAGGNCAEFTEAVCIGSGGSYQGDGTDCGSASCPSGGACCHACPDGNTCVDVADIAGCQAAGGYYAGDGTDCGSFDCFTIKKGDLDGDGVVTVFDFSIFSSSFGMPADRCSGDLDCDGTVTVFDFAIFSSDFGQAGVTHATCP